MVLLMVKMASNEVSWGCTWAMTASIEAKKGCTEVTSENSEERKASKLER